MQLPHFLTCVLDHASHCGRKAYTFGFPILTLTTAPALVVIASWAQVERVSV